MYRIYIRDMFLYLFSRLSESPCFNRMANRTSNKTRDCLQYDKKLEALGRVLCFENLDTSFGYSRSHYEL